MVTVISFINMKGGVGKTTIVTAISEYMSSYYGRRTLLIDIDPQTNATISFISEDDWKERNDKNLTINAIFEDYVHKTSFSSLGNIVVKSVNKKRDSLETLDLLPSSPSLSVTQEYLYKFQDKWEGRAFGPDEVLIRSIGRFIKNYGYVFIDCPPNIGVLVRNALKLSDFYIIPVIPDWLSTYGITELISQINNTYEIQVHPLGIVLSKYSRAKTTHNRYLKILSAKSSDGTYPYLFKTIIPERAGMERMPGLRPSEKGYTGRQLTSGGEVENAIEKLANEIENRIQEIK